GRRATGQEGEGEGGHRSEPGIGRNGGRKPVALRVWILRHQLLKSLPGWTRDVVVHEPRDVCGSAPKGELLHEVAIRGNGGRGEPGQVIRRPIRDSTREIEGVIEVQAESRRLRITRSDSTAG